MVTLSLPCFSSIFLSATTRVSTFRPPTRLELMGDLFALPGSSVAGVANSSGITNRSLAGGLGASVMLYGEEGERMYENKRGGQREREREVAVMTEWMNCLGYFAGCGSLIRGRHLVLMGQEVECPHSFLHLSTRLESYGSRAESTAHVCGPPAHCHQTT